MIGDESLQPRVLVAQPPQLLQITQLHPAVLALPPMEGRRADVRFPADGRYRLAALLTGGICASNYCRRATSSPVDFVRAYAFYTGIPISVRKRDGAFPYPKYRAE